jgi:hypothetical protein
MNEVMPNNPTPPRRVKRRIWHVVILCLVVFACGMVVGGGLTVMAIAKQARHRVEHPELRTERALRHIARKLDLADTQTEKLRPVLDAAMDRFDAIHREVSPRLEAEMDRLATDIATALPADKADQWREHFNHLRSEWIPKPPPARRDAATTDQ